jgi:Reverse transcriptase (RNA-dependent DNA polymerase)
VERRLFKSALSYKDSLSQDPINWPPAIKEELQSLEENGAAFRFLVAIFVFNGWSLRNLDIVITAFLNGDVDAEVYMGIPEGMNLDSKKYILKLRRSLYGLRQASRIWWERMRKFLLQSSFKYL